MDVFVLFAINAIALALMYLVFNARIRKALDERGAVERVRREISGLLVELNAAADRNVSLVEDRMAMLRAALAEADRRLGVMDRELARRKNESDVYAQLKPGHRPPSPPVQQASPVQQVMPERPTSVGKDVTVDAAPSAPPSARPEGNSDSRVPFVSFSAKPVVIEASIRERVLELRKRGFSNDMIAARLSTTIAEVDLVVQIEEQRILSGREE